MTRVVALLTIFVLLISGAAYAEDEFKIFLGYSVGGSVIQDTVYYQYFDVQLKDKYESLTHGPYAAVQYEGHKIFVRGTFDYNWHENTEYYPMSSGVGLKNTMKIYTYKFEGDIGYRIIQNDEFSVTPYIGAGYLYEKKTFINSNGFLKADWPYGVVGGIVSYSKPQWSIGLDVAALMPFAVRTEGGGTAGEKFETTVGIGGRVQVPVTYNIIQKQNKPFGLMLFATPFYEYSDTGKSDAINSGFWKLKTTREHFGVKAGVGFVF
jgi:hypothetical protein